ncbi:redoxin domain-containing protein [Leptospira perolatii]|nr:redoxin domain-containing protein [Leptospira perolatii]
MKLKVGDSAKNFSVLDYEGKQIRSEDYLGKSLYLAFFRNVECALCNLRIQQLLAAYPEFQKNGIEILAVFESSASQIADMEGIDGLPFRIIADKENKLYNLYGVQSSWLGVIKTMATGKREIDEAKSLGFEMRKVPGMKMDRMPAEFLIGPNGKVQISKYSSKVTDHIPIHQLFQFAPRVLVTT